jgi:hypothetical protein
MKTLKTINVVLISLVAAAVAVSLYGTPTPTPVPRPRGVFYLPSQTTINTQALNNPNVNGVVIGARWSELEPTTDNGWVWTALDGRLNTVEMQPHPKPIRLEIATGGPDASPAPVCTGKTPVAGNKPHWLIQKITDNGGKFFSYWDDAAKTKTRTIPVFWDTTLLAQHSELVHAVADHIRTTHPVSYGLIKVVFVPYANAQTDDWNLGDTSHTTDQFCNDSNTPEQRWVNALNGSGYANMAAALVDAGNQTYAAYHDAFPEKLLTTSIGRLQNSVLNPFGGTLGRNISESVLSTAKNNWPGFIVAQKNNLNGGGQLPDDPGGVLPAPGIDTDGTLTDWNDLWNLYSTFGIPTAAQMVFKAYGDYQGCPPPVDSYYAKRMNAGANGTCQDSTQMLYYAVKTGISYYTLWQEIYEEDILNLDGSNLDPHIPLNQDPTIPSDVINYARIVLCNCD